MTIRIGVLGGIGPESTNEFYGRLIQLLQKSGIGSNTEFPQIIINSIPAPELIRDNVSEADLQPYMDGLKELEDFGVDFIVMVCNTIHLFRDRLQKNIRTEILDLRQELGDFLIKNSNRKTTVFGTPLTIRNGLYRFSGIESIDISENDMKQLSDAILKFNRGEDRNLQVKILESLAKKYIGLGSETIILGCTELALMLKDADIPKIDTITLLAEMAAKRAKSIKNGDTND